MEHQSEKEEEEEDCGECPAMNEWMITYNKLLPYYQKSIRDANDKLLHLSNEEKLDIYGLFKHIMDGDCPKEEKAGFLDVKRKRMIEAWRLHVGDDQLRAMYDYITIVHALLEKYISCDMKKEEESMAQIKQIVKPMSQIIYIPKK